MAYIWRFEDDEGQGVYCFNVEEIGDITYAEYAGFGVGANAAHPMPPESWLWDHQYYYGFASLEQARKWMYDDEWLERLEEVGVMLVKYSARKQFIKKNDHQVAFFRDKARIIRQHKPTELLEMLENA